MEFEWDRSKVENEKKHGVSFEEATEVFADDLSSTVADPDHSLDEKCLLVFGTTSTNGHLVVAFTDRGDTIRIISARRMTRQERSAYEQ
jgi:uncharacterized DUF497 family protein